MDKEEKNPHPEGNYWSHLITDEDQLKEVFEYYDYHEKPNNT